MNRRVKTIIIIIIFTSILSLLLIFVKSCSTDQKFEIVYQNGNTEVITINCYTHSLKNGCVHFNSSEPYACGVRKITKLK